MPEPTLTRSHRTRLMQIWRSAGWPCQDALEIDLLAARMVALHTAPEGHAVLRLTDAGIQWLAEARQRGLRALSAHDRLAQRFAEHLLGAGRIVWRELSLRAAIEPAPPEVALAAEGPAAAPVAGRAAAPGRLWADDEADAPPARAAAQVWRMARPDLFSVRNTTVPAYLQPMVHEVKASRADLLSDLRHGAKRQAYQWLCEECYYVFPAGMAAPEEIPEPFGVWVLHGEIDHGRFELLRPARHAGCSLPFAVWMALCKATPLRSEGEPAQGLLGEGLAGLEDADLSRNAVQGPAPDPCEGTA
ncbi:hypothetical protein AVME950_14365 [Acidovorax sp. SUPP950]|uniref:hypothetical protein n=1 Tax=Acidovorax sp. SUPP950 TaxID=511901 RepID=UPI0023C65FE4|nr:hypothetical protein [Acidovorax sp. SUPP950]GKS76091.1 hypothetical protein AVME950_14365 [Acidovorax sp. SUPP950]